jgi:hypothetical protein
MKWGKALKMNWLYLQGMAGFHNLELTVENQSDKTHGATNYIAELDEVTEIHSLMLVKQDSSGRKCKP